MLKKPDKIVPLGILDVTEELCQACGACCNITVPVTLDERFEEFLSVVGATVVKFEGDNDNGLLQLGFCTHLVQNGDKFMCSIYETRPKMCSDYNCVAWAKCHDVEKDSHLVAYATEVFNKLNNITDNK